MFKYFWVAAILVCLPAAAIPASDMPWIVVSNDKKGFLEQPSGKRFIPWGFNYDHDDTGKLLEDYWDSDWAKVEKDFRAMKAMGANVVRIHLQIAKFMEGPDKSNSVALEQLTRLVKLAENVGIYLDLTGLGCYYKADVPAWYDKRGEKDRWDVQTRFWQAIAAQCASSPAIFCYDLMNEPVVPGGRRNDGDWLGPPFAGKHFVQFVTLDQKERPRQEIARMWVKQLATAIREKDKRHLITVGLVDWSLDRPGLTSGFVPESIVADLDFLSVHIYPVRGKVDDALKTLAGFSIGKPVVIEEIFPLKCSMDELAQFVEGSKKHACGWIGFYWGKPPEELRRSKEIKDVLVLSWLDYFEKNRPAADR